MQENMVVMGEPKTFNVDFHWPRDVDENLKHGIEFIIKSMEFFSIWFSFTTIHESLDCRGRERAFI